MNMHSTVKVPGSNYLCMYSELKRLNMQKSQVEQDVGVSQAEKTYIFTHTCTNAHTHTHAHTIYIYRDQSRYTNATQKAMPVLFLSTLLHKHTHATSRHSAISTYCSAYSVPCTVGLHCSFKSCLRRSC